MVKKFTRRMNVALFNIGASLYDLLTTQAYWEQSVVAMQQHFQSSGRKLRILDLGCGAGVSSFAIAGKIADSQVVGVDIASKMIERAVWYHQRRFAHLHNIEFLEADASHLPFETHSFDIAVGHSFLYLVPEKLAVLREVKRVLKKDGQLILMEPHAGGSLLNTLLQRTDYIRKAISNPGPTIRFIASIIAWRGFSLFKGQFSTPFVRQLFSEAGFRNISSIPTLNGLGLYCIGFA